MDDKRFDDLAQSLRDGASRRAASRLLAGGALAGIAGWLGLSGDGEAKKKRKKKRKKKSNSEWHCPNDLPTSCPPDSHNPQGFCAPAGYHCCGNAGGGGACPGDNPQCCAPTVQDPGGLCIPSGSVCCTSDEGGGYCNPGKTCCPPCEGWPDGFCADPGYPCWMACKSGLTGDGSSEGYSERKSDAPSRSAAGR
jgi:hypothetical protein